MTTTVAIIGAHGRMGRLVADLIDATPDFTTVAALGSSDPLDGMLAADVVVDVTVQPASQAVVDFAVANGKSVLVGTSGWTAERIAALRSPVAAKVAGDAPGLAVVFVPNFSIGSVLATSFAATAARFFESIEIVEAHHASKVDSPSGTAVRTAELIGQARASLGPVVAPHTDQRARGQQVASVPIHSLRMQGVVARQDVIFGGTGEVLTLTHETLSPTAYSAGIVLALRAMADARGVVVGLDRLIDLSSGAPIAAAAPAATASAEPAA
ncbi:MAG: dapB [Microbacteriaceae bacterium]|nr:dapB [Microbacteriaceae bacterium]